jgi:non-lysosomal glucosylceramidase
MDDKDPLKEGEQSGSMASGTLPRRQFLKQAAVTLGAVTPVGRWPDRAEPEQAANREHSQPGATDSEHGVTDVSFPRIFRGSKLKMISFPLGGVGAGCLGLGGRGQLRDWEIFNRPNKGFSPNYAFPAIWVQSGNAPPIARVLEARVQTPYEGQDGLGWQNVPGLSRLQGATFTGEYPLAHIDFEDSKLPLKASLDAFSPFIPHEPGDSGLPVAVLRYRIQNPSHTALKVGLAFSIDNPVLNGFASQSESREAEAKRVNDYRSDDRLAGLLMSNPGLDATDPVHGTFVLAALPQTGTRLTHWRGWPKASWWTSPLMFWDTFAAKGELDAEPGEMSTVGVLCQSCTIEPGETGEFTFLLAWHFPNRTPDWCGWTSPPDKGKTVIGNFYSVRFKDAWDAARYTAENLDALEQRTRQFAKVFRESSVPDPVKEAASANLSTLASTTCFRTADGDFHGFEGSDDTRGCCFGNCTHVWNYETATAFLFPSFARSLRKASFGFSQDEAGGIRARQVLPDGETRDSIVAADGHMGQIMHAYFDWKLSADKAWLQSMWPNVRRALAFAWVPGGWDPSKTGVAVGVQNNTYDVAFFGPNPLCGIYYLGALRAGEEMALAVGDQASADEYRRMFQQGSQWIDANLFKDEFYIQQIKGFTLDQINPTLRIGTQGFDPTDPQLQLGSGCLIDQLMGQYLAHVMDLGYLVAPEHIRKALESIYKYNYKRSLVEHDNVERTFALNDESAMVICDYGKAERPRIPFPYFAEVMTGFEHSTAALMLYSGMVPQGIECIRNIRARYDGEKRNPWDEAECGHHYARAMASWSSFVAVSGFAYDAPRAVVVAVPRIPHESFHCFWSTGTGWGSFSYSPIGGGTRFSIEVIAGTLGCRSCEITGWGKASSAETNGVAQPHTVKPANGRTVFQFNDPVTIKEGQSLTLEVRS